MTGRLLAISDIHVRHQENRDVVDALRPTSEQDWLIVAGDVADTVDDVEWALGVLARRFARVVWVPGNHDLWATTGCPERGEERYRLLVRRCRNLGVLTPEDDYPVWHGPGGPVRVAPLFLLYDYTFRQAGTTKDAALDAAYRAGVVLTDEKLLDPAPYPSREAWCAARVTATEHRLACAGPGPPFVLVNHWPLHRAPTAVLRHQEMAMWCGTARTADWHSRFDVAAVVYGHLHLPRTTTIDGVRFEEVSLGYPADWSQSWHPHHPPAGARVPVGPLRTILPHSAERDIRW
ncbi:metallophosphoesterase family protein [Actinophytocola sp. KF-1]